MTTRLATQTFGWMLAIALTAGPRAAAEDTPDGDAGKTRQLAVGKLVGRWQGEKDGTQVKIRIGGGGSSWALEQRLAADGKLRLQTDRLRLADDPGDPARLTIELSLAAEPGKTTAAERAETLRIGTLRASAGDTLALAVLPAAGCRPVEGLVLRRVPAAEGSSARADLTDEQATTCDVLSDLNFEQRAAGSDKPDAPPKFTVTRGTLEFLKKYEGHSIEVSDDGSLEIEEK